MTMTFMSFLRQSLHPRTRHRSPSTDGRRRATSGVLQDFHDSSDHASTALLWLIQSLCAACARQLEPNRIQQPHTLGRFYTSISPSRPLTELEVDAWLTDSDHGLLHGLCAYLMGCIPIRNELPAAAQRMLVGSHLLHVTDYATREQADVSHLNPDTYTDFRPSALPCEELLSLETLAASCLLHDFAKCIGHEDDGHDQALRCIFPNLLESTYSHATPANYNHPLVIGDVLELKRYPDYACWYDPKRVEPLIHQNDLPLISRFYENMRPALARLYAERHRTWLRHGPEVPQPFYPTHFPEHPIEWLAVESDRLPLEICATHGNDIALPWSGLHGLMSLATAQLRGAKVSAHRESYRDHWFLSGQFAPEDWVFVVAPRTDTLPRWVEELAEAMLVAKQSVVRRDVLQLFCHATHLLETRLWPLVLHGR